VHTRDLPGAVGTGTVYSPEHPSSVDGESAGLDKPALHTTSGTGGALPHFPRTHVLDTAPVVEEA
jgi:hypothetical protein